MSDRSTDKELLEMIEDSSRWVARTIIPQLAREIQTERARISTLEKERELLQFAVSAHERNLLEHSEANAALERRLGELERALIDIRDHIAFIPLLNEASKGTLFDEGYVTGYHHAVNWRLERFDAIAYALASTPREGTEEKRGG